MLRHVATSLRMDVETVDARMRYARLWNRLEACAPATILASNLSSTHSGTPRSMRAARFGRCPGGSQSSDASKTKTRGAEQHVVHN